MKKTSGRVLNPTKRYILSKTNMRFTTYSLAHFSALHTIKGRKFDLSDIYNYCVPNRVIPFYSNGVAAPYFGKHPNSACNEYMDLWQFNVGDSVSSWMKVIHTLYSTAHLQVHLLSSWDVFDVYFKQHVPIEIDQSSLLIPLVYTRSTPSGERTIISMVTLSDYIAIRSRPPSRFVVDLFEIVLFGFIVDRETVRGLGLYGTSLDYITRTLRQGSVDSTLLSYSDGSNTSSFDSYPTTAPTKDHYSSIGKHLNHYITKGTGDYKKRGRMPPVSGELIRQINQHGVGPYSEDLVNIAKLGGFSHMKGYSNYLTNERWGAGITPYSPAGFKSNT